MEARSQNMSRKEVLHVWILTLILILTVVVDSVAGCPYMQLDSGHTMCIFKPRMCSGKRIIKSGGLACLDRDIILKTHNHLRQKLALGRVTGQPAALNMETMVWNDELAMVAQRWADQCMPGHDRSRNIGQYTVGQNVAAVWTYERDEGSQPDFRTQIEAWFNEVMKQGFSKSNIEPFRYSKIAGHYTQLAWADTYMVGCGYSYYHDKKTGYTKLYVCNYAPGGNVVGGSMYEVGFPGQMYCTSHGLRQNGQIKGLCVRDNVEYQDRCMKTDNFMRPPPPAPSVLMMTEEVDPVTNHHLPRHPIQPSMTAHFGSSSMREPRMMMMTKMTPPPFLPSSISKQPSSSSHLSHHNRFMSHGMAVPSSKPSEFSKKLHDKRPTSFENTFYSSHQEPRGTFDNSFQYLDRLDG